MLESFPAEGEAEGPLLSPIEASQEVWASGVTYERSRQARKEESDDDLYDKVYAAERPELFFKALGWRVVGNGGAVRVRRDSGWNVPEPELVLVVNSEMEIIGYTAGNDVSSRDIEGENALYLPQAKVYDGSCALGPGILLDDPANLRDLAVELTIERDGTTVFEEGTRTSKMKRGIEELADYLGKELEFPDGSFLMTGTGVVPGEHFSLRPGDAVRIMVGGLVLANNVV